MKKQLLLATLILGITKATSAQSILNVQPELIIKTVVAKGSVRMNEFGEHSDWLEAYNTTNQSIDLSEGDYYISDNPRRKRKFKLKKGVIPAKSSIVIWCDDQGGIRNQIHANFKLSSRGETLTISKLVGKEQIVIDQIVYEALQENGQMALVRKAGELKLMQLSNSSNPISFTE
ncbi:MAG: hypothetical protein ACI9UR_001125 [Bacteroidia bacterium]|jgi:hypothetical protein